MTLAGPPAVALVGKATRQRDVREGQPLCKQTLRHLQALPQHIVLHAVPRRLREQAGTMVWAEARTADQRASMPRAARASRSTRGATSSQLRVSPASVSKVSKLVSV